MIIKRFESFNEPGDCRMVNQDEWNEFCKTHEGSPMNSNELDMQGLWITLHKRLMETRYSKKIISKNYYKSIEVGNDTNNSNSVFLPYVIDFTSPEQYSDTQLYFKSQYEENHICCPKCRSEIFTSSLYQYAIDIDDMGNYKDENKCVCLVCNDTHIRHDRLPKLSIRRHCAIDAIFKSE